eukprot:TRINITY_DN2567_c0_g1_i2.p1 TRINITY_DN2567_c0_g1~~TRINITY_DN2567_c0_g1_i2.p1  ORF type:complete len:232 (-),score=51.25 TRINITY_DN2567_c0_g1_i2:99-794(-)
MKGLKCRERLVECEETVKRQQSDLESASRLLDRANSDLKQADTTIRMLTTRTTQAETERDVASRLVQQLNADTQQLQHDLGAMTARADARSFAAERVDFEAAQRVAELQARMESELAAIRADAEERISTAEYEARRHIIAAEKRVQELGNSLHETNHATHIRTETQQSQIRSLQLQLETAHSQQNAYQLAFERDIADLREQLAESQHARRETQEQLDLHLAKAARLLNLNA